jgi:uncharacterized protein (DUF1697 family)
MTKSVWIVLFRGVGGKTQLPVAQLRERLTEAGFTNVATYINSGNAIVESALSRDGTVKTIADVCARHFSFDKAIYAVSPDEWQAIIDANPFPDATEPGNLLHAALLDGDPPPGAVDTLRGHAGDGERIAVVGRVAYIHTPNGFGRSKLAERFDRGIGVPNTARNWNTVLKLSELAGARASEVPTANSG